MYSVYVKHMKEGSWVQVARLSFKDDAVLVCKKHTEEGARYGYSVQCVEGHNLPLMCPDDSLFESMSLGADGILYSPVPKS